MATAWTLSAKEICRDAMEHMNAIGADQTISAEDFSVLMRGLDGILKELPVHGYSWPQITVDPVALAWSAGSPSKVTIPGDYFGVPYAYYMLNGQEVAVRIVSKAEYDDLVQQSAAPPFPRVQHLYIAPDFTGHLWPIPESDPGLQMTYQAIVPDAVQVQYPKLPQTWVLFIGLWLAWELCNKFGVSADRRADIQARYLLKRNLCLGYATETAPICIQVAD
ncbi:MULTISPECIES: hypothetical protein [unclassified Herbaspirillum]|uniref:hypothetical protein n=1 Tax=unclassified Herbaspirillum TaxID=2624150 RepID=UPI00257A4343|nr:MULTISPECIES: hypothetical protein [unclassified Herbaspirillum]|tara:strand:- start:3263 stop:3925 length:663 start_codon:yes stop_codon:yes gene_type:complete